MTICYLCGGSGTVDSMYGDFKSVCPRCKGVEPITISVKSYERHPLLKDRFWKDFLRGFKCSLNFHPSPSNNRHERFIQALIKYNKTMEFITFLRKNLPPIIVKTDDYNIFESQVCKNIKTVEYLLISLNNKFSNIRNIMDQEAILTLFAENIEDLTSNIETKLSAYISKYPQRKMIKSLIEA